MLLLIKLVADINVISYYRKDLTSESKLGKLGNLSQHINALIFIITFSLIIIHNFQNIQRDACFQSKYSLIFVNMIFVPIMSLALK